MISVSIKIQEAAKSVTDNLLPDKSREQYLNCYQKLSDWKTAENIDKSNFSETVIAAYFAELESKIFQIFS